MATGISGAVCVKKILRLGVGLTVLALILAIAVWFLPANNETPVRVSIQQGDTISGLSRQWQADGWLFVVAYIIYHFCVSNSAIAIAI